MTIARGPRTRIAHGATVVMAAAPVKAMVELEIITWLRPTPRISASGGFTRLKLRNTNWDAIINIEAPRATSQWRVVPRAGREISGSAPAQPTRGGPVSEQPVDPLARPVVTIFESYGSGASTVGPRVAEALGVRFLGQVFSSEQLEEAELAADGGVVSRILQFLGRAGVD